jgi:queuine tRNA-ribosyltransferase
MFKIEAKDGRARAGTLTTLHGEVKTPVFMPVATQASVKAVSQEDLETIGVRAILANSYHLYLRPGTAEIEAAGGLHKFMDYDGMILTDSGGFQVMSQSDLRVIDDHGVDFKSHIDGSKHRLTPEKVIQIQAALNSDCWTALDECPAYPCAEAQAESALTRTMRWMELTRDEVRRQRDNGRRNLFFPILQGSVFHKLRTRAAEHIVTVNPDGIALGGFSVGEPKEQTWELVEHTTAALPEDKPRYLMGVGTPEELWHAVGRGVDMLDCVFPTRVARNGQVMTHKGKYNITNSFCRGSQEPLDPECACFVCKRYTRSYLRHIHVAGELISHRLLSYHNLFVMHSVMENIRAAIHAGEFESRRRAFLDARVTKMP